MAFLSHDSIRGFSTSNHVWTCLSKYQSPEGHPAPRSRSSDRAATSSIPVSGQKYRFAYEGELDASFRQVGAHGNVFYTISSPLVPLSSTQVRHQAQLALASKQIFPNKTRPTEVKERCTETGRGRGVLSRGLPFGLCRVGLEPEKSSTGIHANIVPYAAPVQAKSYER